MRKILSLSVFFLLCLTAGAEDFTYEYEGHTLTYTIIDEEARTCKLKAGEVPVYTKDTPGNDVSGDVVIPSEAKYYRHYFKVIEIPTAAFSGCSGITSVTIPDGITSIGYHAFSNCTGLTSVTIPNSVTDIGGDAFAGCTGLTSVTISNNVTSIGNGAFYICRGLTEVTIPNSVVSIGDLVFAGCSGLRSVAISNSVTAIRNQTFRGCSSLTSVTIPKSVTEIGGSVFYGCTDLTDIYILNPTPPSADRSSFDEQNYKNATLYVPEEAYETYDNMTDGPWKYFLKLKSIETPTFYFDYDDKNMTAIVTEVNKDKLSSYLEIPETTKYLGKTYTVVAIGEEAFKDCSGVIEVTVPDCIMSIGMNVFYGCSSLTKVNISDLAAWCNIKFIHYASNPLSYAHHLYLNGEEVKDLVIPDGVTSIGDYAFYGCSSLTSVVIPNSVTSIGGSSFDGCSGLPSVIIPNSVKSIGDFAFNGCSGLHNVTIPNSVTYIGGTAFQNCCRLTNVTIPNGVTKIGGFTFSHCSSLRSVSIPNSVTSIGEYAFQSCSSLTSVEISNRVTAIDKAAFRGCINLKEVYSLNTTPPSTSTDKDPFSDDIYQNAKLYVPEEALEAYRNAEYWKDFRNIQGFESPIFYFDYDDNKVTATIAGVNKNKISSEIVIPETTTHFGKTYTVVAIGDNAFSDCSSVTSVTIPNSIMTIGESALWNCSGLTSITIPSSVTAIGRYAFVGCYSLTEVYSFNLTPPNVYSDRKELFLSSTYQKATLYVPEEALEAYRNAEGWKKFQNIKNVESFPLYYFYYNDNKMTATITRVNKNNLSSEIVIPETTTYNGKTYTVVAIGDEAFKDCSITSVTIPNSITAIGEAAFEGCTGLTKVNISDIAAWCNIKFSNVSAFSSNPLYYAPHLYINGKEVTHLVIPDGVTAIGNWAFEGYSGLTSVTIPNSVTSIGGWAFYGCSDLTSVAIPNSVTSIGRAAFEGCSSLTSIAIPNSIISIGKNTFSGCSGMISVTIPNSVTSIGDYTFSGCSGLTSVTIPNSVTNIGENAFEGCSSLTSVAIPNSVTTIGDYAFMSCSSLISVSIPNSVTSIGWAVFCNCSSLPSVTIPNSVTSIMQSAFLGCSGLTMIIIPNSVTSIGGWVFYGCSGLTSVTIPNSITSLGDRTFLDCNSLTEVYSLNLTPPSTGADEDPFDDRIYKEVTLYVPEEALTAYKNADSWKKFQNIKGFDPTGMKGIEADGNDKRNVYYDLNGRRLSAPKKGLNIINGKKVIIK